ncbi:MAG: MBL fold metallo-hydrolase [Gemmatimonas sp.]|uniref:MBL fold metallo-hydrolase n=1 Tax=Gemmatimonas sp. TaxID=1962908 RepID=UPI0025C64006|nr:MBL fold metallo-hydrolase [Gemmatimonas sp.]MCA2984366.1 MBL fold metallo-hydrolase [Gemmatimonas sp.]MCA2994069.1 MBL fold metallo-hydrolase [Gemmatimonas sp.]
MNDRLPAGFPAPLLETRTVGRLTVHAIQAGGQQLDGGAMFGVVPKTLWSRRLEADAKNRIPLGMRCLLIEHDDGLVLLDTGLGNKENAKFHDIYGVENRGDDDRTALEDGLRAAGFTADDVSLVINTHLHFDHAGGNSWRAPSGEVLPTFRRARYLVQAGELDYAEHTNERTAASYFPANWHPVVAAGQFDFVRGEQEVRSGVTVRPTPGHTPHHQSVIIRSGGETLCFLGDLIPTSHHLPLPWIMGYDVEPLVTLESKRALLAQALREEWLLVFEHDAHVGFGRLAHDGKSYHLLAAG